MLKCRSIGSPTPTVEPSSGVLVVSNRAATLPTVENVAAVVVCVPPAPLACAVTWYCAAGSRPSVAVHVRASLESWPGTGAPPTFVTVTEVRLPVLLDTVTGASSATLVAWSAGVTVTSGGAAASTALGVPFEPVPVPAAGEEQPASTAMAPMMLASKRSRREPIE